MDLQKELRSRMKAESFLPLWSKDKTLVEISAMADDRFQELMSQELQQLGADPSPKQMARVQTWAWAQVYLEIENIYGACRELMEKIKHHHPEAYASLRRKRKIYFPTRWQVQYTRKGVHPIAETFKKYPLLVPILNAIFDHNRRWKEKSEEFQSMARLCDQVTNGKRVKGEHYYSSFAVDQEFCESVARKVGAKADYVKKHFLALVEAGVYKKLGVADRKVSLYSDGYFVRREGGGLKKTPWLIRNPHFIEALSAFKPKGS